MNSFFTKIGITHYVSCPHAHHQNGAAERKHRHIVEVALSLLAHAAIPLKFWHGPFATAAYLINRTPTKLLDFSTSFFLSNDAGELRILYIKKKEIEV
jgi:hypothetical protein